MAAKTNSFFLKTAKNPVWGLLLSVLVLCCVVAMICKNSRLIEHKLCQHIHSKLCWFSIYIFFIMLLSLYNCCFVLIIAPYSILINTYMSIYTHTQVHVFQVTFFTTGDKKNVKFNRENSQHHNTEWMNEWMYTIHSILLAYFYLVLTKDYTVYIPATFHSVQFFQTCANHTYGRMAQKKANMLKMID